MSKEKKVIRHLLPPKDFGEWLYRLRYTWARRIVQFALIAAFIGTFRWGWALFGKPLLSGDLSSSKLLDTIPLADPFASLQRLFAQYWLSKETLIGAGIVLVVYLVISGRSFCAWVCPMNLVTDFAYWCREKLGIRSNFMSLPGTLRYLFLVLSLILSAITATAAFEAFSPQALLWRDMVYGSLMGVLSAVFGVFALDLVVSKRAWCGHLCPLGAFWACYGTVGIIKVKYDDDTCTRCGDCLKVCPEPQVLNFNAAARKGMIASGECTNCGKCIAICPEDSLKFGIRSVGNKSQTS